MEVIEWGEGAWFFLRSQEGAYYIDVRCSNSAAEFSMLIELTEDEINEYRGLGKTFLNYFAAKVAYWYTDFTDRNIVQNEKHEFHKSIMEWIQSKKENF